MCHIRYSVLTDFIYITLHAQDPKNMWKDMWNTAIFHLVFGKKHWILKGLKTLRLKYLMWMCHMRYSVLTEFIYITLHTQKPNPTWKKAIFQMIFGQNTIGFIWIKNNKAYIYILDITDSIYNTCIHKSQKPYGKTSGTQPFFTWFLVKIQ